MNELEQLPKEDVSNLLSATMRLENAKREFEAATINYQQKLQKVSDFIKKVDFNKQ